ncbi:MAG: hypothetical protein GY940_42935, partial [bacterium]|nr:hypothetical protein [bacterium]
RSEPYDGAKPHHNFTLRTSHFALYFTGDLARWLEDGSIEFLGRIDHQVKVRGFRVETGEIEARLVAHESVKEAVVLARTDKGEGKYLCAYIVPDREKKSLEVGELKDFLSRTLPDYMIPAHFVQLDRLPLSSNGKLNRKALPEPTIDAGENHEAPATVTERNLAAIWSELLGIDEDEISINSTFSRLGGNSLTATVLVLRIRKEFNVQISMVDVLTSPTIKQQAAHIDGTRGDDFSVQDNNLVLLKQSGDKAAEKHLFLIHDSRGGVEMFIQFCHHLDNHLSCWDIKPDVPEHYLPFHTTIETVAARYIKKKKKV